MYFIVSVPVLGNILKAFFDWTFDFNEKFFYVQVSYFKMCHMTYHGYTEKLHVLHQLAQSLVPPKICIWFKKLSIRSVVSSDVCWILRQWGEMTAIYVTRIQKWKLHILGGTRLCASWSKTWSFSVLLCTIGKKDLHSFGTISEWHHLGVDADKRWK